MTATMLLPCPVAQRRARYIVQTRTAALRARAIGVLTSSYGAASEPPTPGGTRRTAGGGGAENSKEREAAAELAAQLERDSDIGEIVNPGPFPRYRCLLTLLELKAVMQQGVAETPHFKSYLMRQKLQAYENEVSGGEVERKKEKRKKGNKVGKLGIIMRRGPPRLFSYACSFWRIRYDLKCGVPPWISRGWGRWWGGVSGAQGAGV